MSLAQYAIGKSDRLDAEAAAIQAALSLRVSVRHSDGTTRHWRPATARLLGALS